MSALEIEPCSSEMYRVGLPHWMYGSSQTEEVFIHRLVLTSLSCTLSRLSTKESQHRKPLQMFAYTSISVM